MNSQNLSTEYTECSNYWWANNQPAQAQMSEIKPNYNMRIQQRSSYATKLKLKQKLIAMFTSLLVTHCKKHDYRQMMIETEQNQKYGIHKTWQQNIEIIACQLSFVNDALYSHIVNESDVNKIHDVLVLYFEKVYFRNFEKLSKYEVAKQQKLHLSWQIKNLIKDKEQKGCFQIISAYLQQNLSKIFQNQERITEINQQRSQQQMQELNKLFYSYQNQNRQQQASSLMRYSPSNQPTFRSPRSSNQISLNLTSNRYDYSQSARNESSVRQFQQYQSSSPIKQKTPLQQKKPSRQQRNQSQDHYKKEKNIEKLKKFSQSLRQQNIIINKTIKSIQNKRQKYVQ